MSVEAVLERLRRFLLGLAGFMAVGTIVELALTKHWDDAVQLLPFALAGLSFLSIVAVLVRPQAATLRLLRWSMVVALMGSLFGVYEHIENNIEFAREIHPNATAMALLWSGLAGGNPLLAPGILAFTAVLALAATYYHPELIKPASRVLKMSD